MANTCDPDIYLPDEPPLPVIPDSTITTETVTEGCLEGNGIYDVFMRAHLDAIHEEYKKQRIKGSEYSQVYLGGMQAAMTQAVGFALGKDKSKVEEELARYAIVKTQAEIAAIKANICLTEKQIEKIDAEINNLKKQEALIAAQTWAEIAKTTPEIEKYMSEVLGINGDPNFTGPLDVDIDSIIGSQIQLTNQKIITEEGQVDSGVFNSGSILGRKADVARAQANGFNRNAEVAVAKLYVDGRSVAMTTLDGVEQGSELESQLDTVLKTARANSDNTSDV